MLDRTEGRRDEAVEAAEHVEINIGGNWRAARRVTACGIGVCPRTVNNDQDSTRGVTGRHTCHGDRCGIANAGKHERESEF